MISILMSKMMVNFFQLPEPLPTTEQFDSLLESANFRLERIISTGQITPPGQWYDQGQDEWVILIQGEACLEFEDGSQIVLKAGDHLLIPAHQKHRVTFTSCDPPCLWLALHGQLTS
jgi:cupin 2 domain-containing protein